MYRFTELNIVMILAALVVFAAGVAPAQEVISVRAGFLHHAEGEVFVADKEVKHDPARKLHVEMNEHLRTGKGRAEMMFALGTMIRLDENSELEVIDAGMTSASLRMISGSAIIDAAHVWDPDSLSILSDETKIEFPENGYYRLDARSDQPITLKVFAGKAVVSLADKKKDVKKKRAITIAGNPGDWAVAKFKHKKKDDDGLDQWSKDRAKAIEERASTLMASGARVQQNDFAQEMYRMYMRANRTAALNSMNRTRSGRGPGTSQGGARGGGGAGGARGGGGAGGARGGGGAGGARGGGGGARGGGGGR